MLIKLRAVTFKILLLIFPFLGYGQYNLKQYNRLTFQMKSAKTDDRRLELILAIGDYHVEQSYMEGYQKSMDTARTLAVDGMKLARKIKSPKAVAKVYLLLSKIYNYESNYSQSIAEAEKAIAIFTRQKDNAGLCYANRTLFRALRYLLDFKVTSVITTGNLSIARKTKSPLLLGIAYEDCAQNSLYVNDDAAALVYINEAIKHYKAAGKQDLQQCYAIQALLYSTLNYQEKAFQSSNMAVTLAESLGDTSFDMAQVYNFAAKTYVQIERYETAKVLLRKALMVAKKYIDPQTIVNQALDLREMLDGSSDRKEHRDVLKIIEDNYSRCNVPLKQISLAHLTDYYASIKNYEKADKYFDSLKAIPQEYNNKATAQAVTAALIRYNIYKKNISQAKLNLNRYKARSVKLVDKAFIYHMHFKIDSLQGNYLQAIKHYQLAGNYTDSIFNLTRNRQLTEMEVLYDVERRKKDNLLLSQKAKLQQARLDKVTYNKNLILGIAIFLGGIAILIIRQYRMIRRSRKQTTAKNKILEQLITEKENLLNEKEYLLEEKDWLLKEIHHRVKNNLQVVMSLLNTQSYFLSDNSAKEAIRNSQHRIHSMSLIHKKLYQSDNIAQINMAVYFWELIEYYKIAFDTENRIRFELNVEPVELDSSLAVPVGLILNEAINNALKHAFPDNQKGIITIRLETLDDNNIVLCIKDNGIGIAGDITISNFSSLGMKLIRGFCGEINAALQLSGEGGLAITLKFCYNRNTIETPLTISQAS